MPYQVGFMPRALRQLDALPRETARRILNKVEALAVNPRPPGVRLLQGDLSGYRLRVGDYRVLYIVDDSARTVTIHVVGHRREVYR